MNDTQRIYKKQGATICVVAQQSTVRIIGDVKPETWRDRAKRRMAELGLKQHDLMVAFGVTTRGAVGHYLRGDRTPTPEQIQALAKKLGCTVGWLLNNEGSASATHRQAEDVLDRLLLKLRIDKKSELYKHGKVRSTVIDAIARGGDGNEEAAAEIVRLANELRS